MGPHDFSADGTTLLVLDFICASHLDSQNRTASLFMDVTSKRDFTL